MRLSPCIDLIWRFAANEMAAGEFKEIEPEHFCMALLKFAELPEAEMQKAVADADAAKLLIMEVKSVHEALTGCSIDTTRVRRQLRARLGQGGVRYEGGQIHRSAASRELFNLAAQFAAEGEADRLTAMHLLAAIVKSPTPVIAQALRGVAVPASQRVETPALDKCGEDLVQKFAKGELDADSDRTAECKAILQILASKKSVFLVADSVQATESTLASLANLLHTEAKSPLVKGYKRLIRPTLVGYEEARWETLIKLFDDITREAAQRPGVLLVCSLEDLCTSTDPHLLNSASASRLAQTSVRCIVLTSPKRYDSLVKADAGWRRLAEPVWVREDAKKSVPKEL
jgi:hypothetical protein